jgi:hypothetical protein
MSTLHHPGKIYVLAVIALQATACASKMTNEAIEAAESSKDIATRAAFACAHRAAHELDDGKSDAATIGFAVVGACSNEFTVVRSVYGQNMSQEGRLMLHDKMKPAFLTMATQAVLSERALKQKSKSK